METCDTDGWRDRLNIFLHFLVRIFASMRIRPCHVSYENNLEYCRQHFKINNFEHCWVQAIGFSLALMETYLSTSSMLYFESLPCLQKFLHFLESCMTFDIETKLLGFWFSNCSGSTYQVLKVTQALLLELLKTQIEISLPRKPANSIFFLLTGRVNLKTVLTFINASVLGDLLWKQIFSPWPLVTLDNLSPLLKTVGFSSSFQYRGGPTLQVENGQKCF